MSGGGRTSGGTYRADAVDTWLRRRGWVLDRIKGSHFRYKHPDYAHSLGVVYHGRVFEGWQMRNLESDLRKIGQAETAE